MTQARSPAARDPEPRILTFLIADIRGYTAFTRAAGDEAAARLASAFAELVREGVEARGGEVVELRGDEAMAVFTSSRSALRAATELQAVFADETAADPGAPLRVGIGIDAGEAVPVEGGYRGGALNLAARLCSAAGPGETIASEAVVHLAQALDGIELAERTPIDAKGIDRPVAAFDVRSAAPPATAPPHVARTDLPAVLDPATPLVGDGLDARALRWSWRQARRGEGRAVVLTGPRGSGKTRLAAEAAVIASRDGATMAYASGADPEPELRQAIAVVRAATGPTLVVLDDLESALEEDLERVIAFADEIRDRPILVVASTTTIPSADDTDALARAIRRLSGGAAAIRVGPLDEAAVASIVALYSADPTDPPPVRAIAEASNGLPSRVHALAAEWAQEGATRRLGAAASLAAIGRRDLRRLEGEVASNVVGLQLARERQRLYAGLGTQAENPADSCPFKGLAAFEVADADVFFGRERLVAELVGRLAGTSILGIVGPSGSGKSSTIRAGLLPALASGALPGAADWMVVVMRPGIEPMRELDRTTFAALGEAERDAFQRDRDPLESAAEAVPRDRRLLVVVDQFEELFAAGVDPAGRERFIDSLVAASHSGRVTVIVGIRADFYGRCAEHPALAEALGASTVLVGPMTADEYRRAIEGPARRVGLRIDPGLTEALVGEVLDEPGGLPLLSTALVELWQRREGRVIRMRAYLSSGGVRGAVARLAEAAYALLTEAQQALARAVFLRLAGDDEQVVRRRVPLTDFDIETDADLRQVLAVLTQARLISIDEGTVEVAHEALLREWPRLAAWLDEDQEGRRLLRHVADSAHEWDARGRDPGELYRGARLVSTVEWTAEHGSDLNALERTFITESRAASERDEQRQRRSNRRLRILLAAAGGALVVAVAAGGLALVQRGAAEDAAAVAELHRQDAERAATVADAQRLGAQALNAKELDLSLLLARQAVALDDSRDTQATLLGALLRSPVAIRVMRPPAGRLEAAAVTDDGRYLLVGSNDGLWPIIDTATGTVVRSVDAGYVDLSPDGKVLVLEGGPLALQFQTIDSNALVGSIRFPDKTEEFAWARDLSTYVAVLTDRHVATVYDATTNEPLWRIAVPDDRTILRVWQFGDGVLTIDHVGPATDLGRAFEESVSLDWWPKGASQPAASAPAESAFVPFRIDPAMRVLAVGREDGSVGLTDLVTGAQREVQGRHEGEVTWLAFSPDGMTLVSTSVDEKADVWDVATGSLRQVLVGHSDAVSSVAVSGADGHLTAYTASHDGLVIAWDLTGDRRLGRPFTAGPTPSPIGPGASETRPDVVPAPDGRTILVPSSDGTVAVIDATTLAVTRREPVNGDGTSVVGAVSPDGTRIIVGGVGVNGARVWDTTTWQPVGERLVGPKTRTTLPPLGADPFAASTWPNVVRAVAYSHDGSMVAAGSDDGFVYVWDRDGRQIAGSPFDTHLGSVLGLAFSPDSTTIVAAYDLTSFEGAGRTDGLATAWRLTPGPAGEAPGSPAFPTIQLGRDYGRAAAIAFSPDGKTIATGGGNGQVRFWDATSGAQVGRWVTTSSAAITSVAFDPTGALLAAGAIDGTIQLVDVASYQLFGTALPAPAGVPATAVFSSDGQNLVTLSGVGTGAVWHVSPSEWASQACDIAGRTLTPDEWDRYMNGTPTSIEGRAPRPYQPACR